MEIAAAYGFRVIYDNSADKVGSVLLVLDDAAGDVDPSSFIQVAAVFPSSSGPQIVSAEYVNVYVRGAYTLPINSRGKRVLHIQGYKTIDGVVEYARVPFTVTLQDSVDATPPAPYVPTSGEESYGDALV